jgi:hypothetical protein
VAAFVWSLSDFHSGAHTAATNAVPSQSTPAGANAVGTCLGSPSPGNPGATALVSCASPHLFEVTGYAPVSGVQSEPSAEQWQQLIGNACEQTARTYVGGPLQSGYQSSYIAPSAQQWSAGHHVAECTLYKPDSAGHPVPFTGSQQNA